MKSRIEQIIELPQALRTNWSVRDFGICRSGDGNRPRRPRVLPGDLKSATTLNWETYGNLGQDNRSLITISKTTLHGFSFSMFKLAAFFRPHRFQPWVTGQEEPTLAEPVSQLCTEAQMDEPVYSYWCGMIRESPRKHRKQWEFCYILQALYRAGVMRDGARGLGFGVGREPLAAVLAERGCHVVATDMDPKLAAQAGWTDTNQYAAESAQLNDRGICQPDLFVERVQFRVVDMTRVPNDLTGFDFVWSSCSLEHLGSLEAGIDFIWHSLDCLRPGGIAVHTTEYNFSSNKHTVETGGTVLYRRRDIEELARNLIKSGYKIHLNLHPGSGPLDQHIDTPPYKSDNHLKLQLGAFVTTSIGLVIEKAG